VAEAAAQRLTSRAAIAGFFAYVLMLYSTQTGAVLASQDPSSLAALPICHAASDAGDTTPNAPNRQQHDHSYCTLCGAGHCGTALPTGIKQAHPRPAAVVALLFRAEWSVAPPRHEIAARPKGPPVST
jgi:hypothetical protein